MALPNHRADGIGDKARPVEGRDDDGHQRLPGQGRRDGAVRGGFGRGDETRERGGHRADVGAEPEQAARHAIEQAFHEIDRARTGMRQLGDRGEARRVEHAFLAASLHLGRGRFAELGGEDCDERNASRKPGPARADRDDDLVAMVESGSPEPALSDMIESLAMDLGGAIDAVGRRRIERDRDIIVAGIEEPALEAGEGGRRLALAPRSGDQDSALFGADGGAMNQLGSGLFQPPVEQGEKGRGPDP
ncbi:MAG TPA: hypothetical protein VGF77_06810 [Allosphingosinicella sp.]